MEGRKKVFYLTAHSTHFFYGYYGIEQYVKGKLAKEETCCNNYMVWSFRLAARDLLYAPSHRLCYTSRGALAGTRNT